MGNKMSFEADGVQGLLFPSPTSKQVDARHLWAKLLPEQEPDAFQKAQIHLHSNLLHQEFITGSTSQLQFK
jgi:hypothetical protein